MKMIFGNLIVNNRTFFVINILLTNIQDGTGGL
jgi:hypothetical protein